MVILILRQPVFYPNAYLWWVPKCISKKRVIFDCYRIDGSTNLKWINVWNACYLSLNGHMYWTLLLCLKYFTSKLPFLNCITDVLFMHVPSGNIKIGSLSGSSTCSLNLKSHMDSIWGAEDKLISCTYQGWQKHTYLWATWALSLAFDLSNQIWAVALFKARSTRPNTPPCNWAT